MWNREEYDKNKWSEVQGILEYLVVGVALYGEDKAFFILVGFI